MAAIERRTTKAGKTVYRVKVRLQGFAPESATFDTRSDAKTWAARTEADIKAGRHFGAAKRHTFKDLADEFRPHCRAPSHLDYWVGVFGPDRLDTITSNRIAAERDKLAEGVTRSKDADGELRKRTPTTVKRYMANLSVCLSHAVKELQWLEANPVQRIKMPVENKGRVRFLSDDELVRLLDACRKSKNKDLYTAVVISLTTGGRQSEIMGLRWPQVDLKRRLITLDRSKNGDRRALPLVGDALDLLTARSKIRDINDDRVFIPGKRAKKAKELDLRDPWLVALKEAKIEDFHWHDLRHTAASAMAMAGVSLVEIAKVLGHRTMQMVARYSHLSEGHIVETGERLAEKLKLGGVK